MPGTDLRDHSHNGLPIVTHRKRIPWYWAGMMVLPWIAGAYFEKITQQPMIFTLNKFIEDPALISFISSINILFNFLVGVVGAYLSDHVWTRLGRRLPFLIASAGGTGVMLLFIPIVGNFWILIAALVAYQFFVDLSKCWEPLFNEVVPPPQRGRATMLRMLAVNGGNLFFAIVLISQFDNTYELTTPFGELNGEMVLYWGMAAFMFAVVAFYLFFVRETKPPKTKGHADVEYRPTRIKGVSWLAETDSPKGIRAMFADMFADRQAIWVYFLYLCPFIMTTAGMYSASYVLFITDQLGVSKQDYGTLEFYTQLTLILTAVPAGFLADRISRPWMFRTGILVPAIIQLAFLFYLRYLSDYAFTLNLLISVGVASAFFQAMLFAVWGPLIYDYIPSNRMGTYVAGISFTQGLLGFVLMNLGGLWVKGFTALFSSPTDSTFDYSSIVIFWALLAALSFSGTLVFSWAERRGIVEPLGRLERKGP
ncbi:MAG: MFS transporter [Opitutales bacterium]